MGPDLGRGRVSRRPGDREFIAFWLKDGRVAAGMNVNIWDVNDQIVASVAGKQPVDPAKLRDPDVELSKVVQ